jgi:hypothetical protein
LRAILAIATVENTSVAVPTANKVKTLRIPNLVDERFSFAFRTVRDIDDSQLYRTNPVSSEHRSCRNDNDQAVINDNGVTTDTASGPWCMPQSPSWRTRRVQADDLIDAQQDPREVGEEDEWLKRSPRRRIWQAGEKELSSRLELTVPDHQPTRLPVDGRDPAITLDPEDCSRQIDGSLTPRCYLGHFLHEDPLPRPHISQKQV